MKRNKNIKKLCTRCRKKFSDYTRCGDCETTIDTYHRKRRIKKSKPEGEEN